MKDLKIVYSVMFILMLFVFGCAPSWVSKGKVYGIHQDGDKFGVMHISKKKDVFKPVFDELEFVHEDKIFKMRQGEKYCLGDVQGKLLLECKYDDIQTLKKSNLVSFKKNGKVSVFSLSKEEIIVSDLDGAELFGEAAVVHKDDLYGVIVENGRWLAKIIYDKIQVVSLFEEDHFVLMKDKKLGLSTWHDGFILKPLCDKLVLYPDLGYFLCEEGGLYSSYSYKDGKRLMPATFKHISHAHQHGYIYQGDNGLYGFADIRGRILSEPIYESVSGYYLNKSIGTFDSDYYFAVKQDDVWGFVDYKGRVILEPRFENKPEEWIDAIILKEKGKFGILDFHGNEIVPFIYDKIDVPKAGRAVAHLGDRTQYVYLSQDFAKAWKRQEVEEAAEAKRKAEARERRLREEVLEAEREAIYARKAEFEEVQSDINRMSRRISDINRQLDDIGREMDDNSYKNTEREQLYTELDDLKRRISERERQRKDLSRMGID